MQEERDLVAPPPGRHRSRPGGRPGPAWPASRWSATLRLVLGPMSRPPGGRATRRSCCPRARAPFRAAALRGLAADPLLRGPVGHALRERALRWARRSRARTRRRTRWTWARPWQRASPPFGAVAVVPVRTPRAGCWAWPCSTTRPTTRLPRAGRAGPPGLDGARALLRLARAGCGARGRARGRAACARARCWARRPAHARRRLLATSWWRCATAWARMRQGAGAARRSARSSAALTPCLLAGALATRALAGRASAAGELEREVVELEEVLAEPARRTDADVRSPCPVASVARRPDPAAAGAARPAGRPRADASVEARLVTWRRVKIRRAARPSPARRAPPGDLPPVRSQPALASSQQVARAPRRAAWPGSPTEAA